MVEFFTICVFFAALIVVAKINFRQLKKKRLISTVLTLPFSITLLTLNILLVTFVLDHDSYERLTREHTVATISFRNINHQQFEATIKPAFAEPIVIDLQGDQWQVDTRILKWKGPPAYFGLQPLYLLERISGRYQTISDEKSKPRSIIALETNQSFNYWNLLIKYQDMIPWLDAYYGNAVYLPMKDRAKFMIMLGQHGLIARPRNIEAAKSVKNWFVHAPSRQQSPQAIN